MGHAIVLGATGYLGRHLRDALAASGMRVVGISRSAGADVGELAIDVTRPAAAEPSFWSDTLTGEFAPGPVAIINLVACKYGDRALVERVNVAAVLAMAAARSALASRGVGALTLHLGSVSEYRKGGKSGPYAAGKRAARAACQDAGIDLILTLGPVTGRATRTPASQSLRRMLRVLPRLRSSVRVGITPVAEAAAAVAALARHGASLTNESRGRPRDLVLAGTAMSWGEYLGLPDRRAAWSVWEPLVWRVLTRLEGGDQAWSDRLGSLARIALHPGASHYEHVIPPAVAQDAAAARSLGNDWRIVPGAAGDYLIATACPDRVAASGMPHR
jgi:nucleoside-diphosphate-sugar epimerase